jgi:hypothetical protein
MTISGSQGVVDTDQGTNTAMCHAANQDIGSLDPCLNPHQIVPPSLNMASLQCGLSEAGGDPTGESPTLYISKSQAAPEDRIHHLAEKSANQGSKLTVGSTRVKSAKY